MLLTGQFRQSYGFQRFDPAKQHPIMAYAGERYARNVYNNTAHDNIMMDFTTSGIPENVMAGSGIGQKGDGLGDNLKTAWKILKFGTAALGVGKLASKVYDSETMNKVRNSYGKFMNKSPNWRPGFAGEKHMLMKRGVTANWCGPGTHVEERIMRGDRGVDPHGVDLACRQHDIDYMRAESADQVREADRRLINAVNKTNASWATKSMVKGAMKAKMLAEDTGVMKKGSFANFENEWDPISEKKIMADIEENSKYNFGQQQQNSVGLYTGSGMFKKKKRDPAHKLKRKFKLAKKRNKAMTVAIGALKKRIRARKRKK